MTGRSAVTLSDAQRAEVETLAAVLTAAQIADFLGIGRTTFFALVERDPELSERSKRGKARAGNVTAMIFFLKTQGGWRETIGVETQDDLAGVAQAKAAAQIFVARLDRMVERQRALACDPREGPDRDASRQELC